MADGLEEVISDDELKEIKKRWPEYTPEKKAGKYKDLTGLVFNRLVVLYRTEDHIRPSGRRVGKWVCRCMCGNIISVEGHSLTSGNTKSCGCLKIEKAVLAGKSKKAYNTYDLSGDYGIGYTSAGTAFYFDLEDYDLIRPYCWYKNTTGYMRTTQYYERDDNGKIIRPHLIMMHQLILGGGLGGSALVADHINGDRTDNRKENLRLVTYTQNAHNSGDSSRNTSGHKGVSWNKSRNKWEAYITHNKKHTHLGLYHDYEEAVRIREDAEAMYFGEYARKAELRECAITQFITFTPISALV